MNALVLGRGKTGSLVAEVARQRGHSVAVWTSADNPNASALTNERLKNIDVVVDFTTPQAVIANIEACAHAGRNMVVGTTGWYGEISTVRKLVEQIGIGLVYGSNFSVGVNLFFEVARTAAKALGRGYEGRITEIHHTQKKDAPSGTAVVLNKVVEQASGRALEITSLREGDVVGTHVLTLESANDRITLSHEAHSRRGFAEGAVLAAEWLAGRKGFYDFRDVFREMKP
jgi:4-hydroxy-tetrahydrodipicolinate reductase